jgi:hypothetical protein
MQLQKLAVKERFAKYWPRMAALIFDVGVKPVSPV